MPTLPLNEMIAQVGKSASIITMLFIIHI